MGCARSRFEVASTTLYFSEGDDALGCLCTFPHNHRDSIGPDTILSLAMLGAAVRLLNGADLRGWVQVPEVVGPVIEAQLRTALGLPSREEAQSDEQG